MLGQLIEAQPTGRRRADPGREPDQAEDRHGEQDRPGRELQRQERGHRDGRARHDIAGSEAFEQHPAVCGRREVGRRAGGQQPSGDHLAHAKAPDEEGADERQQRSPRAGGVLVVSDTRADEVWREHPLVTGGPRVGFYAGASIFSRGERVGVVCAYGSEARDVTPQERAALEALSRQAAGHLELRRRPAEPHDLALTDALTGLANRRLLVDRLERALADRERAGGEVGVLFCVLDDFKAVNDRFGHEAGDRLLRDHADHLRLESRAGDTVGRFAGDEFVVVCPRLDSEADLIAIAGRVERAADQRPLMPDGSLSPGLSVGAVIARTGERPVDILGRPDAAMYDAKAESSTRRTLVDGQSVGSGQHKSS